MKMAWHLFWTGTPLLAAVIIGHDWYSGRPAAAFEWALAIVCCLMLAMNAAERAFPSLKR